jgi:hypothetical protein
MTAVVRWSVGLGFCLLAIAAVSAFYRPERGDTACGTVFYNTVREGSVCSQAMRVQTAWTAALAASGVAAIVAPPVMVGVRAGRPALAAVVLLTTAAAVLGLIGLNRLIQPDNSPHYCGSIVNRHTTNEPSINDACDRQLAPRRRAAALSLGSAALAAAAAAGSTFGQSRRRWLPLGVVLIALTSGGIAIVLLHDDVGSVPRVTSRAQISGVRSVPFPEGPASPEVHRGDPLFDRLVAIVPIPLPQHLEQGNDCSFGNITSIILADGRTIDYGPCGRPPSIDALRCVLAATEPPCR